MSQLTIIVYDENLQHNRFNIICLALHDVQTCLQFLNLSTLENVPNWPLYLIYKKMEQNWSCVLHFFHFQYHVSVCIFL